MPFGSFPSCKIPERSMFSHSSFQASVSSMLTEANSFTNEVLASLYASRLAELLRATGDRRAL